MMNSSGMCRKASPASAAILAQSGARSWGGPQVSRTLSQADNHSASNAPIVFARVRNSPITTIGTTEKAAASGMFPAVPCCV